VFRIGHLGHFNDLMLAGTLSGVEMGLKLAKIPHKTGGIIAALESLAASHQRVVSHSQAAETVLR
jgi:alanine-glyoxylate transaminase / serine-glyoxylate transaminase / serine-pyruvate transaminase